MQNKDDTFYRIRTRAYAYGLVYTVLFLVAAWTYSLYSVWIFLGETPPRMKTSVGMYEMELRHERMVYESKIGSYERQREYVKSLITTALRDSFLLPLLLIPFHIVGMQRGYCKTMPDEILICTRRGTDTRAIQWSDIVTVSLIGRVPIFHRGSFLITSDNNTMEINPYQYENPSMLLEDIEARLPSHVQVPNEIWDSLTAKGISKPEYS